MEIVNVPIESLHADITYPGAPQLVRQALTFLAAVDNPLSLEPGARAAVPAGIRIAVPLGYEAQVRTRSGLTLRSGLVVLNAPGTVDSDYHGEVVVLVINVGREMVDIRRGDRVAQLVLAPIARIQWRDDLPLPATHAATRD